MDWKQRQKECTECKGRGYLYGAVIDNYNNGHSSVVARCKCQPRTLPELEEAASQERKRLRPDQRTEKDRKMSVDHRGTCLEPMNGGDDRPSEVLGVVMPDPCVICKNTDCAKILNPCRDRLWYAHNQLPVTEMALDYYRSALLRLTPDYVPTRIRLIMTVCGDGPFRSTRAEAGEYPCTSNRYGAISITAENGQKLGVKLGEFVPVEWVRNPRCKCLSDHPDYCPVHAA